MKVIYICHEYGGKEENKNKIEQLIRKLVKQYPDYIFVSAVNAFGYLYNDVDYNKGIKWCLWLLSKCDELWAIAERSESKGCLIEKDYCLKHNKPVKHYPCFMCDYNNHFKCGKDFCILPKCIIREKGG